MAGRRPPPPRPWPPRERPRRPGIAFVADGAEGPRGWKASGAPWRAPSRGLTLDLSALKNVGGAVDSLAEDFKAAPTAAKAGIAVAALVAGATLLFQEAETVLEIAGLVAAGQFAAKRLVFASDRQRTADELSELVDAKIGVAEAGADLKRVADALLEDPVAAAGGAIKAVAESGPSSSSSSPSSRAAAASSPKPAAAAATAAAAAAALFLFCCSHPRVRRRRRRRWRRGRRRGPRVDREVEGRAGQGLRIFFLSRNEEEKAEREREHARAMNKKQNREEKKKSTTNLWPFFSPTLARS